MACGGHVTPPLDNMPGPLSGPPLYHYHKSPECLAPFRNASLGFHHGAQPYQHAQLMGDLHWTPFLFTYYFFCFKPKKKKRNPTLKVKSRLIQFF